MKLSPIKAFYHSLTRLQSSQLISISIPTWNVMNRKKLNILLYIYTSFNSLRKSGKWYTNFSSCTIFSKVHQQIYRIYIFFFFFYPRVRNTTELWDRIENMYFVLIPSKGGICVEGVYKSIRSNSRNRVTLGIYDLHEWLRKLFRAESYNEGCFDRQTVLARRI